MSRPALRAPTCAIVFGVANHDVDAPRLDALATVVRNRRRQLNLKQGDLEERGGPSTGTVRNIEQSARTTRYAERTLRAIEGALDLELGILDRVVDGSIAVDAPELTPETLRERALRRMKDAYSEDYGPATVQEARDQLGRRPIKPSLGTTAEQRLRHVGGALSRAVDSLFEHPDPDQHVLVALDAVLDVVDQLGIERQWDEKRQQIVIPHRG